MITLDASPYRQRVAKKLHESLNLTNITYSRGLFSETLGPSLRQLNKVDLAFIDGHHQYQPTIDYLEQILEFSHPDTIFVFDDIRWSDGMERAWAHIKSDPRLNPIVDLVDMGLCAMNKDKAANRIVTKPIHAFLRY